MKYIRYDAPPELRLRYHFRNRFGQDIERAREYDLTTGIGYRAVPESDNIIQFFEPNGYVEIDGHVNPSQEVLQALFDNSRMVISNPDVLNAVAKKVSEDVRLEQGLRENNPQQTED